MNTLLSHTQSPISAQGHCQVLRYTLQAIFFYFYFTFSFSPLSFYLNCLLLKKEKWKEKEKKKHALYHPIKKKGHSFLPLCSVLTLSTFYFANWANFPIFLFFISSKLKHGGLNRQKVTKKKFFFYLLGQNTTCKLLA